MPAGNPANDYPIELLKKRRDWAEPSNKAKESARPPSRAPASERANAGNMASPIGFVVAASAKKRAADQTKHAAPVTNLPGDDIPPPGDLTDRCARRKSLRASQ
jgi:hypothetical protein